MSTKKYTTKNPVRHNGELYAEGKSLELDDKTAHPLLACGAIAPQEETAEEAVIISQVCAAPVAPLEMKAAKPAPAPKKKTAKAKSRKAK